MGGFLLENMKTELFNQRFRTTLQRDGFSVVDIEREATEAPPKRGIPVVRRWTGYSDQTIRDGMQQSDRDTLLPQLKDAIVETLRPWIQAQTTDNLPDVRIIEFARATGLSVQKIRDLLDKYPVEVSINGFTVKAAVITPKVIEEKDGEKLPFSISEGRSFGVVKSKRVLKDARYESRSPGGGPVVKARTTSKALRSAIIDQARKRAIVSFKTTQDNSEITDSEIVPAEQINTQKRSQELDVSPDYFLSRVAKANQAYDAFVELGPFYGKGKEPTFRVSAEPIQFPEEMKPPLEELGNDIAVLAESLPFLPEEAKRMLGSVDFRLPFSYRLDTIFDRNGSLRVNEVQIADGADALMTAEQMAYGLQKLDNATPAYLARAYRQAVNSGEEKPITIAIVRETLESPYTANILRMNEMINAISKGTVRREIIPITSFQNTDWSTYDGFLNEAYTNPVELESLGIPIEKMISAGDFSAVGNKGLYPLLYDPKLEDFWIKTLGEERLRRIQQSFIPSAFIQQEDEIALAKKNGAVVKGSWMEDNVGLLDKARSVYGPWNSDEQWQKAYKQFRDGMQFIRQDFVEPARLSAFLRAKSGKDVERVDWYNRVCLKYVRDAEMKNMVMTAVEVTLGPNPKPAGRNCCFTAGTFQD